MNLLDDVVCAEFEQAVDVVASSEVLVAVVVTTEKAIPIGTSSAKNIIKTLKHNLIYANCSPLYLCLQLSLDDQNSNQQLLRYLIH